MHIIEFCLSVCSFGGKLGWGGAQADNTENMFHCGIYWLMCQWEQIRIEFTVKLNVEFVATEIAGDSISCANITFPITLNVCQKISL